MVNKTRLLLFIYIFLVSVIILQVSRAQEDCSTEYIRYLRSAHPTLYKKFIKYHTRHLSDTHFREYHLSKDYISRGAIKHTEYGPDDQYYDPFNHFYDLPKSRTTSILQKTTGVYQDWTRQYRPGDIPSYNYAWDMAVDRQNNIYVTGHTTNMPNDMDICTIKYDPQGRQLWSAYYNSGINSDDLYPLIEVDNDGNIYINSQCGVHSENASVFLVKYDTHGNQKWVYQESTIRYSFTDLIVTDHGDIYFLISTYSGCKGILIKKIDANGQLLWQRCYTNGESYPLIIMGKVYADNLYIIGTSDTDIIILKYDPDGQLLWKQSFSYSEESRETCYDFEVDTLGNAYVLGNIDYGDQGIVILKFDPDGNQLWSAVYGEDLEMSPACSNIAIDDSENVFTAGELISYGKVSMIKYDTRGILEWEKEYKNPNFRDYRDAIITIDTHGNPVMSGNCAPQENGNHTPYYFTVKYNPSGEVLWSAIDKYGVNNNSVSPIRITIDNEDDVIVCGDAYNSDSGTDYLTVKYGSNGAKQWEKMFNGGNRDNGNPHDITTDYQGNVYIGGSDGLGAALVKYDPMGNRIWSRRESSLSLYYLDIDPFGNVYGAGDGSRDIWIYKFNPNGDTEWRVTYDGPELSWGSAWDKCDGIVVDYQGNTYLTGNSSTENGLFDLITISYDPSGNLRWIDRYMGTEYPLSLSHGNDIIIENNRNVIVAGYICDTTSYGYLTIKYNSKGDVLWIQKYIEGLGGRIPALTADGWGNVYVTGDISYYSNGTDYKEDIVTIKYSPAGKQQWIARHNPGKKILPGWKYEITTDVYGNVYVAVPYLIDISEDYRSTYVIIKYDPQGERQWLVEESDAVIYDMVLDREHNVYVTGTDSQDRILTAKYTPEGEKRWMILYDYEGSRRDESRAITVDRQGNVYLAAAIEGELWSKFLTIKYAQTDRDTLPTMSEKYHLYQNYPNPFNRKTLIFYTLAREQKVTFNIYNNLGQLIESMHLGLQPAGRNDYHFLATEHLPSGIYYYQLKTNRITKSGKMTLIH